MIELTRKKLREAQFFLGHLAAEQPRAIKPGGEAADFYLSAFLSAARAVPWTLKNERTSEWNAWHHEHWFVPMTAEDGKLWDFFVEQRNKVQKQGGPDIEFATTTVSLMDSQMKLSQQSGGSIHYSGIPGTPLPTFQVSERRFSIEPDTPMVDVCQRFMALLRRLVSEFERDHPVATNSPPPQGPIPSSEGTLAAT
jgi:hypothetical protein